jgi:hypothetical protein
VQVTIAGRQGEEKDLSACTAAMPFTQAHAFIPVCAVHR